MSEEIRNKITQATSLLVEGQAIAEGERSDLSTRLAQLRRAEDCASSALTTLRPKLRGLQSAQERAANSFAELKDDKHNTILYALYALEGKYRDNARVLEELRAIENPPRAGGHCDSTRRPYVFVRLSKRQQGLIREAIAYHIGQTGGLIKEREKDLKEAVSPMKGLRKRIAALGRQIERKKGQAAKLIVQANRLERELWQEYVGRPFERNASDYTTLFALRFAVYGDPRLGPHGQPLTKYVTPCTQNGRQQLVLYRHPKHGELMWRLIGDQDFYIWSAVLFRPFATAREKIALVYYPGGGGSHIQGYLNNCGVFTNADGRERF